MKLFLLKEKNEYESDSPHRGYDRNLGFIVRAESEQAARLLAANLSIDEGSDAWINPKFSSCDELTSEGESCVVLASAING